MGDRLLTSNTHHAANSEYRWRSTDPKMQMRCNSKIPKNGAIWIHKVYNILITTISATGFASLNDIIRAIFKNTTSLSRRHSLTGWNAHNWGKGRPYSITERRVTELIPVLGSQPAGDVSHKSGGRLPLLSARPTVTLPTLKTAATNFAAWWTEAQWVWTVCLRLLPDSVATAIWTRALLHLSPAR